jgi:hypothetical protein
LFIQSMREGEKKTQIILIHTYRLDAKIV